MMSLEERIAEMERQVHTLLIKERRRSDREATTSDPQFANRQATAPSDPFERIKPEWDEFWKSFNRLFDKAFK